MMTSDQSSPVDLWTVQDVSNWLNNNGFEEYIPILCETHKIDGLALLTLSENDLLQSPIQIQVLGDVKRLMICVRRLQLQNTSLVQSLNYEYDTHFSFGKFGYSLPNNVASAKPCCNASHRNGVGQHYNLNQANKYAYMDNSFESSLDENDDYEDESNANGHELQPEAWKALMAMFYFFMVTWVTAFTMVIVHDRVPDMATYPPLPDIFLDNVPLIPWAFNMCELCGLILFIIWCAILVFHKHRFILLRRMFSLFGSVFLLRCVTMLITSLSVPGRHLQCKARPYGNWQERLVQAYLIWQGGGMSLQGVRTCGDYMFSGHTVVLTLLNFFITEYTPGSLYYIHTVSWVFNLFGVFFILAAHEHYSIDVFVAFYISTRLFLYYHTLANNRALYQGDRKRTRIWFPLFYFFESGVNGIVPNHFELPFKSVLTNSWNDLFERKTKTS